MTRTREFNAATVDEAVEKASATLGLPADDFSYEVVDTGSDGFLGIGARDARILVEVPGNVEDVAEGPGPAEPEPAEPEPAEPEPAEEFTESAGTDSPA